MTGSMSRAENRSNQYASQAKESPDVTSRAGNCLHLGSETSPPESVYDDIGDVIEDEDKVAEAEFQGNLYDGLQQSTRVSGVYQQILSDAAAAATDSDVITNQDEHPLYLQLIGDDQQGIRL